MSELFKGYIPTKNKEATKKYKNKTSEQLDTLRQVKHLDEYAGVLNDDTILIDIDDKKQSEILMNIVDDLQLRCRVYETTRGKHFVFKSRDIDRCKTHTKLACGLEADIKLGSRNGIEILKFNGVEREIIYDIFDDEEYELVPKFLLPVSCRTDWTNLKNGDGRNQSLFNYILTLQSNDYSVDEARETIRVMNKYVLAEPLTDDELDVILRDDAFSKPVFFNKTTFLFDKFANYLKNTNNIVKINKQLHMYKDGVYVNCNDVIEREMIKHISNLNQSKRMEVMSYLKINVDEITNLAPAHLIAFKNGIYNMETKQLEEFNPKHVILNKINYNYNPNAYAEIMDKTLNKLACNDKNVRALLDEAIGYTFYRRNELRKCFILTGEKRNGKSTYLSIVKHLLGADNVVSLDLKELGARFKTASLSGKLCNIGDDIADEFIPDPAIFKKLVSGNPINVEHKFGGNFDFENYSKLMFSANAIPRIKDKSGAVIDRIIIIPFDATFSKDDPDYDPYIKYKLLTDECMEYLINIGLQGLERVLNNQEFTKSEKVEKSIEDYEINNNPILLFFAELNIDDIVNECTKDVYKSYNEFCIVNGFTPISNIEFSKQVNKHFNTHIETKSIKGKKHRVFIKEVR